MRSLDNPPGRPHNKIMTDVTTALSDLLAPVWVSRTVSDEEMAEAADSLVGPPLDNHVSRAYSCPVEYPTSDLRGCIALGSA